MAEPRDTEVTCFLQTHVKDIGPGLSTSEQKGAPFHKTLALNSNLDTEEPNRVRGGGLVSSGVTHKVEIRRHRHPRWQTLPARSNGVMHGCND